MTDQTIPLSSGTDGEAIRYDTGGCSLGTVLVAASERGLCAIMLGDEPTPLIADLRARFPHAQVTEDTVAMRKMLAGVTRLVETPALGLDLPLDARGTPFQRYVWQALSEVPAGATASYGEIAKRIGRPKEAKEVAEACAANPLAVAIPCHRIVKADGSISGYRWGVKRKRALLAREAA
jgi:AraC family transcriptional regulator of adaptative response/methylated-DNA-[protein]-cysteine methyltransferase